MNTKETNKILSEKIPTRKELIEDFKRVATLLNSDSYTLFNYFQNSGKYKRRDIVREFRNWRDAMLADGLQGKSIKKKVTPNEILADLKRVAKELKTKRMSWVAYMTFPGKYTDKDIRQHFGTWKKAMEAADMKLQSRDHGVTRKKAIADLKNVAPKVQGELLSFAQYKRNGGKYALKTFYRFFKTWSSAVKVVGRKSSMSRNRVSEIDLIKDLQRMAILLNKNNFSTWDYNRGESKYSSTTIITRFGTWQNALKEAGLG